jgi:hypothetical protein
MLVTLQLIRGIPGSILFSDTGYSELLNGFPQSLGVASTKD